MVDALRRRFNLRPERLVGDTAYGVARLLKWLVESSPMMRTTSSTTRLGSSLTPKARAPIAKRRARTSTMAGMLRPRALAVLRSRADFDVAVSAETGGGGKGSIKVEKLRMPIESRSVCPFGCLMVQNRKINPSIGRFSTLISALRDPADSQARLVLADGPVVGRIFKANAAPVRRPAPA